MADLSLIKKKALANGVDCRDITLDTNLPYQGEKIEYNQLDSESRFLRITYCIGGRVKILGANNFARILLRKEADGTNILDDCYVDVDENVIYCQLDTQALILAGMDNMAILLTETNPITQTTSAIITTAFSCKVNKCVVDSEVTTSTTEYNSFINGLTVLDGYNGRLSVLETSIGNVALLNTTDKTSLVNAINELNSNKLNKNGDASNTTVAFTQASTRTNLTTGEKISDSFSKIMKWFSDLSTVAFSGKFSDLLNKPTTLSEYGITDGVNKTGDTMTGNLILNADPTNSLQAATKQYVDAVASGLDIKKSVKVATTTNLAVSSSTTTTLTLSSAVTTIDGITLVVGNRILVKDQTTASQNGIYTYTSSTVITRDTDADTSVKLNAGMFTFVEQGTVNADTGWTLITDDTITIGTTALTFSQFSGVGQKATFTEASTLANIVSGESQSTIWGKIMKFFNFIGTTALTTTAQTITGGINELKSRLDNKVCKTTSGISTVTGAGGWSDVTISFGVIYDTATPFINIIPTSAFANENIIIKTLSATGMTFSIYAPTNGFAYSVRWFAIGNLA